MEPLIKVHLYDRGLKSLEVVSASYKQLFQAVMDSQSGYVNPSPGFINKTPEKIDILLQL